MRPDPVKLLPQLNTRIEERIQNHIAFIDSYSLKKPVKYKNSFFDFPVVTSQEKTLEIHFLQDIEIITDNQFRTIYSEQPHFSIPTTE